MAPYCILNVELAQNKVHCYLHCDNGTCDPVQLCGLWMCLLFWGNSGG